MVSPWMSFLFFPATTHTVSWADRVIVPKSPSKFSWLKVGLNPGLPHPTVFNTLIMTIGLRDEILLWSTIMSEISQNAIYKRPGIDWVNWNDWVKWRFQFLVVTVDKGWKAALHHLLPAGVVVGVLWWPWGYNGEMPIRSEQNYMQSVAVFSACSQLGFSGRRTPTIEGICCTHGIASMQDCQAASNSCQTRRGSKLRLCALHTLYIQ